MPDNFSWLVPGKLAGSGQPGGIDYCLEGRQERLIQDLEGLGREGIRTLVSLTERPLREDLVRAKGMVYFHLPVRDMCPPTVGEVIQFVDIVENAQKEYRPVLVHCRAGMGRTGTMLACYLASQGCDASESLFQLRVKRPGSVETPAQEEMVYEYARHLRSSVQ